MIQELGDRLPAPDVRDEESSPQLFATCYAELHRLAERRLRRDGAELTLGATTLLHEAYLDICARSGVAFPDRARFIGYTARVMRGIVIDGARRKRAAKRGGGITAVTLEEDAGAVVDTAQELERLSDALDELASLRPDLAELVDLHFFCGYTFGEVAQMRAVCERTVQRDWRKARLLLHDALGPNGAPVSTHR